MLFVVWVSVAIGQAEDHSPKKEGWYLVDGPQVSLKRARETLQGQMSRVVITPPSGGGALRRMMLADGGRELESHPRIVELSRGLEGDPLRIYNYVKSQIDFYPAFGLQKGALGSLLERNGGDLDQASLLVALLRESGYRARFVRGNQVMSVASIARWFDVEPDPNLVSAYLRRVGIPFDLLSDGYHLMRFWVELETNEGTFQLDPAYKRYRNFPGLDWRSLTGYDREALLEAVTDGASVNKDYVQNLNSAALEQSLSEMSSRLFSGIKNHYYGVSVDELIGGRKLDHPLLKEMRSDISFRFEIEERSDEVPIWLRDKFEIEGGGMMVTLDGAEMRGQRLTISFDNEALRPELRLNGEIIAIGDPQVSGSAFPIRLSIDHPMLANDGTLGDQVADRQMRASRGRVTAIVLVSGRVDSPHLVAEGQDRLQFIRRNSLATRESLIGETLSIVGQSYARQSNIAMQTLSEVLDYHSHNFHFFGLINQEASVFVDIFGVLNAFVPKIREPALKPSLVFLFKSAVASGFEHGVIEQMFRGETAGISTIRVTRLQNDLGNRVFFARSGNWERVRANLVYDPLQLQRFDQIIAEGGFLLVPENGVTKVQEWEGSAWLSRSMGALSYRISGGLFGGYDTKKREADVEGVSDQDYRDFQSLNPEYTDNGVNSDSAFGDPVDSATGFWVQDVVDLSFPGMLPFGMGVTRDYNSGRSSVPGMMGYGWRCGLESNVRVTSDGGAALGRRLPRDAVAFLVYSQVVPDLFLHLVGCEGPGCDESSIRDDALGHVVTQLAADWLVKQTVNNLVQVQLGDQSMPFVRLPSGQFSAPAGITSQLRQLDTGEFELRNRKGDLYSFNENGQLNSVQNLRERRADFRYGQDGRLEGVSDAYGRSFEFEYGDHGFVSLARDSTGREVRYEYDEQGDLMGATDLGGFSARYVYDDQHRVLNYVTKSGHQLFLNHYDALNRVWKQEMFRQAGPAIHRFYYTDFENVEVDPLGHRSIHRFDRLGRIVGLESPEGGNWEMTLNAEGALIRERNPRGFVRKIGYNPAGDMTQQEYPTGDHLQIEFNSAGSPIFSTDASGVTQSMQYTANNELVETSSPLGNRWQFSYNDLGLRVETADPMGRVTEFVYDEMGLPISTTHRGYPALLHPRDSAGHTLSFSNQKGKTVQFIRDPRGLVIQRLDPINRKTSYEYDSNGRLIRRVNRNGEEVRFSHTGTGKLELVVYGNSTQSYQYDLMDRLVLASDTTGDTEFSYDGAGRITEKRVRLNQTVSETADGLVAAMGFRYDEAGNLLSLAYPGGGVVRYSYDAANRLIRLEDWLGHSMSWIYENGSLRKVVHFNGLETLIEYDSDGRLIGQRTQNEIDEDVVGYRLALWPDGAVKRVVSDSISLPLASSRDLQYAYRSEDERILLAGETAYKFDEEGRAVSVADRRFDYDALGRMVRMNGPNSARLFYDYEGHRVAVEKNGELRLSFYDPSWNLLAERMTRNGVDRWIYYLYGVGLTGCVTDDGRLYTYHFDQSGNAIALSDEKGKIVNRYSYTPFGLEHILAEELEQPFLFGGRFGVRRDFEGFYYMRARYYDASNGRFLSEDPEGVLNGESNLYAYALSDPVNLEDSRGLKSEAAKNTDKALGAFRNGIDIAIKVEVDTLKVSAQHQTALSAANKGTGVLLAGVSAGIQWKQAKHDDEREEALIGGAFGVLGVFSAGASMALNPTSTVSERVEAQHLGYFRSKIFNKSANAAWTAQAVADLKTEFSSQ